MKTYVFIFIVSSIMVSSCTPSPGPLSNRKMKPIYLEKTELMDIANEDSHPIENTGQILLRGTIFFMVEKFKGIHVFDVSDDQQDKYLTFIRIPALSGFTVSGDRLYVDQSTSLITLDISDLFNVKILSIEEDVFQLDLVPPNFRGFFECVDFEKGAVIGWETSNKRNLQCRTL